MVDSNGKGSESSEDASPNSAAKSPGSEQQKKTCADCGTSKTPLWRGGPAGPKSLCNACGIRSRKKKRAILGISKGSGEDVKKGRRSSSSSSSSSLNNKNKVSGGGNSLNLKQRLWALGRQVSMQRSNHTNKLGEEEQAAVLLMSLSYGSVYA